MTLNRGSDLPSRQSNDGTAATFKISTKRPHGPMSHFANTMRTNGIRFDAVPTKATSVEPLQLSIARAGCTSGRHQVRPC